MLAGRLKEVINSVISKTQTGFIKGRSIIEGPLVVNEIIEGAKKVKKQTMLLKVDFEKAFDTINWDYIEDIQTQFFGDKWRAWIKGVFSTARVSVLVNGTPTKEFHMEKGVR